MSHPLCIKIGESGYDEYIGRPRAGKDWRFGNPFEIGPDGTRAKVVWKFRRWLETGESFGNGNATETRRSWILEHVGELRGKVLGCFCGPKLACHGNILVELSEKCDDSS